LSIELHVRKFYCGTPGRERSIFAERAIGFADSYSRLWVPRSTYS